MGLRAQRRLFGSRPWHDQVVLVVGSSRGLGYLLAREFLQGGADVIITGRDPRTLERARIRLSRHLNGGRVIAMSCDVGKEKEAHQLVDRVISQNGRLDVLVNVASVIHIGPVESQAEDDLADAMNVNFWGTVHVTLRALPHLLDRGQGRIVNITSIGAVAAVPHFLPYTCAKFAAYGFSQGIQAELAPKGIHVTTVVPGLMRTGSHVHALVRGQRQREFAWFSAAATLPGLSMNAERAARRIVRAAARGDRYVVLGVPARMLRVAYSLLPGFVSRVFSVVNRLLPEPARAAKKPPGEVRKAA